VTWRHAACPCCQGDCRPLFALRASPGSLAIAGFAQGVREPALGDPLWHFHHAVARDVEFDPEGSIYFCSDSTPDSLAALYRLSPDGQLQWTDRRSEIIPRSVAPDAGAGQVAVATQRVRPATQLFHPTLLFLRAHDAQLVDRWDLAPLAGELGATDVRLAPPDTGDAQSPERLLLTTAASANQQLDASVRCWTRPAGSTDPWTVTGGWAVRLHDQPGETVHAMALDPHRRRLFLALAASDPLIAAATPTLAAIDLDTGSILGLTHPSTLHDLAVDAAGDVLVTGVPHDDQTPAGHANVWKFAFDGQTFTERWRQRVDGTGRGVAELDGSAFIATDCTTPDRQPDPAGRNLHKLDAATGQLIWSRNA